MKKNLTIGILLFLNISLCIVVVLKRSTPQDPFIRQDESEYFFLNEYCKEEFKKSFFYSVLNQGRFFQVTDVYRDQLMGLFQHSNEKKLFFRLDFPYCGNCVFPFIEMLSKNRIIGPDKMYILSAFPSERHIDDDFLQFMEDKNLNLLNIPDFDLCFDQKGLIDPYLFIMDASIIPERLFFVNQCNGFLLETYLRLLEQFFL